MAVNIGDREEALANEILRTEVGSGVHGMAIAGTDDRDEMGVFIETPGQLLGLDKATGHYVHRTTEHPGARSYADDLDLTIYSLRKWMSLALAGNPTVLTVLFAPLHSMVVVTDLGFDLRAMVPQIVSKQAGYRFHGYLTGQRERLTGGGKRGRVPNRPELIEKYGYDTKYASHALRLGLQGVELMETGRLTLPMPADDLAMCMRVKRGEVGYDTALAWIDFTTRTLEHAIEATPLPEHPARSAVGDWMIAAHARHWNERGLL